MNKLESQDQLEEWAFENIDLKKDQFKCPHCGRWYPTKEAHASSNEPFCLPICKNCIKK